MKIKVEYLPKSEVEIEGELESDIFETYFDKALEKLGAGIKLDGFRKGKIPKSVLLSNIPDMQILEEMAELALNEHYPKILEDEKIDAIGRPAISITKLARNNPLGFKIKSAVIPKIELPEYKGIAKKIISSITEKDKNITVSEEELNNTILDIRKSRAAKKHVTEVEPHVHKEGEPARNATPVRNDSRSDSGGHNVAGGKHDQKHQEPTESELPPFNDEFVQALGPFQNVEDFKTKLKENIKLEKENQSKEKTRLKIVEKIIDESKIELPELLINTEVDKIVYKMKSDISQMGLKFEDYLKHLNKSIEDLRKDFRPDGEKKAKLALILNKIAEIEKITADEIQLEKEIAHILEHYKEADPERVRAHAENVLVNEKVFLFLEKE